MNETKKLQIYLQTLGDSSRLKIINFIGENICSVSDIVRATNLSQPLVSHHLRTLRKVQILETERKGPFVYYKLKDTRILSALGILLDVVNVLDDNVIDINTNMFHCPSWWKVHWK